MFCPLHSLFRRVTLLPFLLLGLLLSALSAHAQQQDAAPAAGLIVGVAPHTSARVILEMYQPLRLSLEKSLGKPVVIQTAPDFTEFARRALKQDYDIAITTGHQARLLQTDAGYSPLLTYKADFKAVALVAKNGKYKTARDLKGTVAQGLSPTSLVTLWGMQWLKKNGLNEVRVNFTSAADSVAQLVIAGDVAVAFTSLANYQKLSPPVQAQLRILAESDVMAGRIYMLNKRQQAGQGQILAALHRFADSPEGQKYFADNKLDGYRPLRKKELNAMDPFAAEVRATLTNNPTH